MKTKYYHTSGTRFKVGDVIGGPGITICLTTQPIPHGTIHSVVMGGFSCYKDELKKWEEVMNEFWAAREVWIDNGSVDEKPELPTVKNDKPVNLLVYELKPFSKPIWGKGNDEFRLEDFAEVVRIVGNAKGILENHYRKFGKESEKSWHFGSKAIKNRK